MQNIQSLQSNKKIASYLARIAVKALYHELALYPKPGLVSFMDNGSHKDMDGELLFKSLFSLRHYFYHISLYAIEDKPLVDQVRLGIQAEKRMLIRTKNINTHRGAIFALGIFCSTISRLLVQKGELSSDNIHKQIITYWSDHLKFQHHELSTSHGSKVKQKYQVNGAKEMAESGYQIVFQIYDELANQNLDHCTFGLRAYCLLLSKIDDTNILHRVGALGLEYARDRVAKINCLNNVNLVEVLTDIHQSFSVKNISPGGVADMIGVLFFLRQLFNNKSRLS